MKSAEAYRYILSPTSSRDYFSSWKMPEPVFQTHPKTFNDQKLYALRNPKVRLDGQRSNPSWRQSHLPVKNYNKYEFSKGNNSPRKQENQPGQFEYILEVPYDAIGHNVFIGGHYFGTGPFISALNDAGPDCYGSTDHFDLNAQTFQIQCTGQIDPYHVADELIYMYPELEEQRQQFVNELSALLTRDVIKSTPTPTLEPTATPIPTPIRTPTPPNLDPNIPDAIKTDMVGAQQDYFDYQLTQAPTPTEIVTAADAKDNGSTWFHFGLGVIIVIVGFHTLQIFGNLVSNATGRGKTKS